MINILYPKFVLLQSCLRRRVIVPMLLQGVPKTEIRSEKSHYEIRHYVTPQSGAH